MNKIRNIQRLIWLVTTLRKSRRMTLRELSRKWVDDEVADGNPLIRSSFNRYRDEIRDLFGLDIGCNSNYEYYLENPGSIDDHSIESWLLSTMTVNMALSDCESIRSRIVLENVPGGEEFLPTIIESLRLKRRLCLHYQKFGSESSERMVEPYTLKLSRRRWYLLAWADGCFKVFALDRFVSVTITDESFKPLVDFSPDAYFGEYFGVLCDETELANVRLRAYGKTASYLRTLPLHHSQRELGGTEEYTDFSLDVRPTADFIGELLSYDVGLEVLKPEALRLKIRKILEESLKRY